MLGGRGICCRNDYAGVGVGADYGSVGAADTADDDVVTAGCNAVVAAAADYIAGASESPAYSC